MVEPVPAAQAALAHDPRAPRRHPDKHAQATGPTATGHGWLRFVTSVDYSSPADLRTAHRRGFSWQWKRGGSRQLGLWSSPEPVDRRGSFCLVPLGNDWTRGAWCGIRSAPGSGDRRPTGDPTNHRTVLTRSAHLLRQRYGREGHRARKVPGRTVLFDREVLRVLGLAAQKDLLTDHPRAGPPRCALYSTGAEDGSVPSAHRTHSAAPDGTAASRRSS